MSIHRRPSPLSPQSRLIESLENRTLLAGTVSLQWQGAATTAFAGHFVLQVDGLHGTVQQQMQTMNNQLGGATGRYHATRHLGADGLFLLESGSQESGGQLKLKQAEVLLKKLNGFRYVEPNFLIQSSVTLPNDTFFSLQWGLNNTGQSINGTTGTPDADIDAPDDRQQFRRRRRH